MALEAISWLKRFNHLIAPLYDYRVLAELLYNEFGDKTLGDSVPRLVIPAFKAPRTEIAVFKTDHHPDFKNDWKSKAWEVARATSAAPTYLGGHEYEDAIFLDGGVWANNPIMAAIVDALTAYDLSREQIQVFSIGTGNFSFDITLKNARRGLFSWREVIKAAMFLTTDNSHSQAALLLGPENILRLEPSEEAAHIELDDWYESVNLLPRMASNHFHERIEDINQFFLEKVSSREKFYASKHQTISLEPVTI